MSDVKNVKNIKNIIKLLGSEGYKPGSSTAEGHLYHPIPFDEFKDIPVHKTSAPHEWKVILNDYGSLEGKKILDIGCANGFFSFNCGRLAEQVVAYEGDTFAHNVNEAIKVYKGINNIQFINEYFSDNISEEIDDDFNMIIMMNIHMWIYKEIGAKRTKNMMINLSKKTDVLYFQTSHKKSRGMFKVRELKDKDDITKYLLECGFSNVKHLKKWSGGSNRKREMFRCER